MALKKYSEEEKEKWFQYYYSLGPNRTLYQVAKHFGVSPQIIHYTAKQEDWKIKIKMLEEQKRDLLKKKFEEEIEGNISRYIDDIRKFEKVILKSIETLIEKDEPIPVRGTRDVKNLVESLKNLIEVELQLREGKQEPISLIINNELIPRIEEAVKPLKDFVEMEGKWQEKVN